MPLGPLPGSETVVTEDTPTRGDHLDAEGTMGQRRGLVAWRRAAGRAAAHSLDSAAGPSRGRRRPGGCRCGPGARDATGRVPVRALPDAGGPDIRTGHPARMVVAGPTRRAADRRAE